MEKLKTASGGHAFGLIEISTESDVLSAVIDQGTMTVDSIIGVVSDEAETATLTLETEDGHVMATYEGYTSLEGVTYTQSGITVRLAKENVGPEDEYVTAAKILLGEE